MARCLRSLVSTSVVSLGILFGAQTVVSQTVTLGDDVARPIPGAGHDYVKGVSDTVNPANGSLHIKIDLPAPPGRGFTLPFALTYDSGEPFHFSTLNPGNGYYGPPTGTSGYFSTSLSQAAGGWGTTLPYVSVAGFNVPINMAPYYGNNDWVCPMSGSYNFYDTDGGSHMLALAAIGEGVEDQNAPIPQQACAGLLYNGVGYASQALGGDDQVYGQMDAQCTGAYQGQGVIYPSDCDNAAPAFTVTDLKGNVYSFPANTVQQDVADPGVPVPPSFIFPAQVEDRNGNIAAFTYNGAGYGLPVTDTIGRTLVSASCSTCANPTSYTVGGLTYTLQYSNVWAANFSVNPTEIYPQGQLPANVNCSFTGSQVSFSERTILTGITLPNGQSYSFEYDSTYGLLKKITYPDGGWVQYEWGFPSTLSTLASFSGGESVNGIDTSVGGGMCGYLYEPPVVLQREVGYSSSSGPAETQTFSSYSTTWADNGPNGDTGQWTTKSTTETDTDNVTGIVLQKYYTYGYVLQPYEPNTSGNVIAQLPVETNIKYYDGKSNLLQTVNKTWADQFEMTSETTTIPNVGTYGVAYCYNSGCSSPTGFPEALFAKYEYGIGQVPSTMPPSTASPGTATRTTTYGYYGLTLPCHFTAPITYQTGPVPCTVAQSTSNPSNGVISTIVPIPSQVVTYSGAATYGSSGWSGTQVAATTAYFDGETLSNGAVVATGNGVSGLPTGTHDETYYGPSATTTRGNPTTVVRWSSAGASPTVTYSFDETGRVLSRTEPCGNGSCTDMTAGSQKTTYSYANSYTELSDGENTTYSPSAVTDAYVTQITDPLA